MHQSGMLPLGTYPVQPIRCPKQLHLSGFYNADLDAQSEHTYDRRFWLCRMAAPDLPLEQFGPNISFREYSLLENPRRLASQPVQPGSNPKGPSQPEPAIVQVCQVIKVDSAAILQPALPLFESDQH